VRVREGGRAKTAQCRVVYKGANFLTDRSKEVVGSIKMFEVAHGFYLSGQESQVILAYEQVLQTREMAKLGWYQLGGQRILAQIEYLEAYQVAQLSRESGKLVAKEIEP